MSPETGGSLTRRPDWLFAVSWPRQLGERRSKSTICITSYFDWNTHSRRRRGGKGGRSPPHSVQNVENSGKYVYLGKNSVYLGTPLAKNRRSFSEDLSFFLLFFFFEAHLKLDRKTVQISVKTFFFGEHLKLDRKTVQISVEIFFFFFGEHLKLGRKNRLNFDRETQCIKSFFGQKLGAPPNHFELLRPWEYTGATRNES